MHLELSSRRHPHSNIIPLWGVIDDGATSPLRNVMPFQENGDSFGYLQRYEGDDKTTVTLDIVRILVLYSLMGRSQANDPLDYRRCRRACGHAQLVYPHRAW